MSTNTPTRTEFEAAAYRWLRMRCADEQEDINEPQLIHLHSNNRMPAGMDWQTHLDTAIAAAMGWPTVPEKGE